MKKMITASICIITLCIFVYTIKELNKNQEIEVTPRVFLIQYSKPDLCTKNTLAFLNEKSEVINEKKFNKCGDISYNYTNGDLVYSMGPGGLIESDMSKLSSTKLLDDDINIVKSYEDGIYYYNNLGIVKDDNYYTKICNNKKCINHFTPVEDFEVKNNKIYVLYENELYIYDNWKL